MAKYKPGDILLRLYCRVGDNKIIKINSIHSGIYFYEKVKGNCLIPGSNGFSARSINSLDSENIINISSIGKILYE